MRVDHRPDTAPVPVLALSSGGGLLLRRRLPQAEEGETTDLQVGRQLAVVVEHVVEEFLEGQSGFVLLHILDFGIIEEFEVMQESVQQLGGQSSVAVHVHHEGMETLHLRVATGELVSLLFTFERDITGSFFFGLGSSGDFLMVSLQFSDGSYLVFNLGEMFCGHFEGFLVASHNSFSVHSSMAATQWLRTRIDAARRSL